MMADSLIGRGSRHMPLLVHPDDHDAWLGGSETILSVATITEEADFYPEHTDERWSTRASIDDGG